MQRKRRRSIACCAGQVFVDLHTISKQSSSSQCGAIFAEESGEDSAALCERYRLAMPTRPGHFIEHQLELNAAPELTLEACTVGGGRGITEDDCVATERLRGWLEGLRDCPLSPPEQRSPGRRSKDTTPSDEVMRTVHQQRVAAHCSQALTRDIPAGAERAQRRAVPRGGSLLTLWIGTGVRTR